MLTRSVFVAFVPLVTLAACASNPRAPLVAVRAERAVEVVYRASCAPQRADLRAAAAAEAVPLDEGRERSAVSCEFVVLDSRDLQAFRGASEPFGCVLSRTEFERVRSELAAHGTYAPVHAPKLVLADGARGDIAMTKESAFLRSFEVTRGENSLLADPEIAVAQEGVLLDARATRRADGGVALELALTSSALVRPFTETYVHVSPLRNPVMLQIPIAFEQHLAANAALGEDEVLVLGGLYASAPERVLVAFVHTRAVAAGETVAVSSP